MVPLSLRTGTDHGWTVVTVTGELDVATAPLLRKELADLGRDHVVVDLGGVDFLDSTGLGVLVGAYRRARLSGGALRLVCADDAIMEVFVVTGLGTVLDISTDLGEATRTPTARR